MLKIQKAVPNFAFTGLAALVILCTVLPQPAQAVEYEFGFKGGVSNLSVAAGTTFEKTGGMGIDLRPQINLLWPNLNFGVGLFYQGHLGSTFGSFPLNQFGLQLTYFPKGLPLTRSLLDNGVRITQNRLAPYLTVGTSLSNVAVTDVSDSLNPTSFNGMAVGYQLGGGLEFPVSETNCFVVELQYQGAVIKGGSATGNSASSIDFLNIGVLLGLMLHP